MSFMLAITPWPILSATLWIILIVAALYLIRSTAHKTIQAAAQGLHRSFKVASKAVTRSEKGLAVPSSESSIASTRRCARTLPTTRHCIVP